MTVKAKQKPVVMDFPELLAKPVCSHHWVIEAANGATSRGHCKLCGDARTFSNSMPMESWSKTSAAIDRELAMLDKNCGY